MSDSFVKRESILARDPEHKRVFWLHHLLRGNDQELRPESEVLAALVEQRGSQRRHLETFRIRSHTDWRSLGSSEWSWDLSGTAPTALRPWKVQAAGRDLVFDRAEHVAEDTHQSKALPRDWTRIVARRFESVQVPSWLPEATSGVGAAKSGVGNFLDIEFSASLWHPRLMGGLGLPRLAELQLKSRESVFSISVRSLENWVGDEKPGRWAFVFKKGRYRIEGELLTPFKDIWTFRTQDSDGVPFFVSEHFFGTLELRIYELGSLKAHLRCVEQAHYESGNPDRMPYHEDIR